MYDVVYEHYVCTCMNTTRTYQLVNDTCRAPGCDRTHDECISCDRNTHDTLPYTLQCEPAHVRVSSLSGVGQRSWYCSGGATRVT